MGKTSATQVLSRPRFGAGARPSDRAYPDPEADCATRSLEAEAEEGRVLGDEGRPLASVPIPARLATRDADAWRSRWTYVGVDLIKLVLLNAVRVLSEHLATAQPIYRDAEAVPRLIRAQV